MMNNNNEPVLYEYKCSDKTPFQDTVSLFRKYGIRDIILDELAYYLKYKELYLNGKTDHAHLVSAYDLVYTSLKQEIGAGKIRYSDFFKLADNLKEGL